MASKILGGIAVAAGTGLAIGLGLVCLGPDNRRGRTGRIGTPSSGSVLPPEPLLDRIERIEARLSAMEARRSPGASSLAEIDLRIQRQTKDIEALQLQMSEIREKEADGDLARLETLFIEMNHPLFTGLAGAVNDGQHRDDEGFLNLRHPLRNSLSQSRTRSGFITR